jgi:membrane protein DedA with SNARE-associated domain
MQARRLIVIGASVLIGIVGTLAIIYLGFRSDVVKFAYSNVALLFISIASIAGIWLDYFLGTRFLKS